MWVGQRAKTHAEYKSAFYTLYKLANQAREKFGAISLEETREIDWEELREEMRNECMQREKYLKEMAGWSFDRVDEVIFLPPLVSNFQCIDMCCLLVFKPFENFLKYFKRETH
jgi:hypothetical protein